MRVEKTKSKVDKAGASGDQGVRPHLSNQLPDTCSSTNNLTAKLSSGDTPMLLKSELPGKCTTTVTVPTDALFTAKTEEYTSWSAHRKRLLHASLHADVTIPATTETRIQSTGTLRCNVSWYQLRVKCHFFHFLDGSSHLIINRNDRSI